MNLVEIIKQAIELIFSFDANLYQIIFLSLKVSLAATFISGTMGIFAGFILAEKTFPLKNFVIIIINALMGIPSVVVGLIVYLLFAYQGPFGALELIYTPTAIIIAQIILIFPLITSLTRESFVGLFKIYGEQIKALKLPWIAVIILFCKAGFPSLAIIILSAFSKAVSEIGAVMIVGGNIDHYTRVMTTAIAVETRMGNVESALALGVVLLLLTILVSCIVFYFKNKFKNI